MHLAVFAGNGAVLFQHHGRIVIDSGGSALEKRQDDHNPQFLGQSAETVRRRAWNGLCQIAEPGILFLAEIKAVVQFLQHHKLGALRDRLTDVGL